MNEHWYKNAIIYAVDIHRFYDANGDGHGDLRGLREKLDYLADLGVTCLWLLPFYPTPNRDNGYDVKNYYDVDPEVGTLADLIDVVHAAGERGIRIIIDLVLDHTSDEHPWFQAARRDRNSRFRSYYSWMDQPPPVAPHEGTIFPGEEQTVWTYDEIAGAYYFHRFYHFEPDLNTYHPEVRHEIERIIDFWLSLGIAGFRIDAASHMLDAYGRDGVNKGSHDLLKEMRRYCEERRPGTVLLGEVDEDPEELIDFFGEGEGDELNLLFNFVLNNYLYLSLARKSAEPVRRALNQIPEAPASGQWANFLRNLDELDLERLTDADRAEVYKLFAPEEKMRIFGRGIRRRLAPMLQGDERWLRLAHSLLLTLPGVPVLVYGDEIGMGEDLSRPGRDAVRAPMQWSDSPQGGFSSAPQEKLEYPVISKGPFRYQKVNVAEQLERSGSLLSAVKHMIRVRRACPEFGSGTVRLFDVAGPEILAHRCTWREGIVIALHNLSDAEQTVELDLRDQRGRRIKSLLGTEEEEQVKDGTYTVKLDPYGYAWFRVRGERS